MPNACDGRVVPPLAAPAPATPAKFQPLTPARLLDTRAGTGTIAVPLAANCAMALPVVGVGGVPATGVAAVALNITATQATGPGFLTVYPCGEAQPPTSTVNYAANQNVANMAQVRVGAGGQVCIFTMSKVDVVVDVLGWYGTAATAGYAPLAPAACWTPATAAGSAATGRPSPPVAPRRSRWPGWRACPRTPPASCST